MLEKPLTVVAGKIEAALANRRSDGVAPAIDEVRLAALLEQYDFAEALPLERVADDLLYLLRSFAIRSDHPRYFGLFNPPALIEAIAGDLVSSALNPQLAVWSHAPAAAAIEQKLVELLGRLIWSDVRPAGTFTSGGTEANGTALLAALARRYPNWSTEGLPRDGRRPAIYASAESHLAWVKLARISGLGAGAVRLVQSDDGLRMSGAALASAIKNDDHAFEPVLVVATAGTTAHGAVDDLAGVAEVGRQHDAHVHVDAAWAGAVLLHPVHRTLLTGIEAADSVTIDPHKWLSVPMGAGMYLARDWSPLATAFSVATSYMPSASLERHDAYIHSAQWSRRFIGAKLFTALATLGLPGYQSLINQSFCLADKLRAGLQSDGWDVVNNTPLPIIAFAPRNGGDDRVRQIEHAVVGSGAAWISSVKFVGRLVLRACITSFETTEADIEELRSALREARTKC